MQLHVHARIKEKLRSTIQSLWNIEPPDIVLNQTPKIAMGELASPICFELAKRLKKAPKAVAEELISAVGNIAGIARSDRRRAISISIWIERPPCVKGRGTAGKIVPLLVLVRRQSHCRTHNINPNKAAHIGHLRNSTIGDTFVRSEIAGGG
jgi:arginyl-tRNA synthetase